MNRHVASLALLTVLSILAAGSVDSGSSTFSGTSPSGGSSAPQSERNAAQDVRSTAAALFTSRYASSNWSGLHIRARSAGDDCGVLLVDIGAAMDADAIDDLHYGRMYAVYEGGIEHFYHERSFRGVVYRDASGHVRRYGLVSRAEAKHLTPC
jgi:hypothetical protein